MDRQEDLFKAVLIEPPPEDHDEVVSHVTVIDALPGGVGQTPQPLDEPIEVVHFESVKMKGCPERPEIVPIKLITAEQGFELMNMSKFTKAMVPRKLHCKSCDKELGSDRGLHCSDCRPHLGEDPGDYRYCGVSGE